MEVQAPAWARGPGAPGAGVTQVCKLPHVGARIQTQDLLQEQYRLLNIESSSSPTQTTFYFPHEVFTFLVLSYIRKKLKLNKKSPLKSIPSYLIIPSFLEIYFILFSLLEVLRTSGLFICQKSPLQVSYLYNHILSVFCHI